MGCMLAFALQPYDIKWQRTIFGNMYHEVWQLPTPILSQELPRTTDASAQTTLTSTPTVLFTALSRSLKRRHLDTNVDTFLKGKV